MASKLRLRMKFGQSITAFFHFTEDSLKNKKGLELAATPYFP